MILHDTRLLGKVLNIALIVGTIIFIPSFIFAPFMLKHTVNIIYPCIVIYPNSILMLYIIFKFFYLFKSLIDDNPFTYKNVAILSKTSLITLIMSILFIIDLLIMIFIAHNTYINYILVLVSFFILFFGISIALYILSLLFNRATSYKEENDLTI